MLKIQNEGELEQFLWLHWFNQLNCDNLTWTITAYVQSRILRQNLWQKPNRIPISSGFKWFDVAPFLCMPWSISTGCIHKFLTWHKISSSANQTGERERKKNERIKTLIYCNMKKAGNKNKLRPICLAHVVLCKFDRRKGIKQIPTHFLKQFHSLSLIT